jgi:hypothetical protein
VVFGSGPTTAKHQKSLSPNAEDHFVDFLEIHPSYAFLIENLEKLDRISSYICGHLHKQGEGEND